MIALGVTFRREFCIFKDNDGCFYLSTCYAEDNDDKYVESIYDDIEVYINEKGGIKEIIFYLKDFAIEFTSILSANEYNDLLTWPKDNRAEFVIQYYDNEIEYESISSQSIEEKIINIHRKRPLDDILNPPTSFNKDLPMT
jgi:hypothetical protein